ncbi:MAG: EAL domain-containing protein [Steroidobacteraceae bacterium]
MVRSINQIGQITGKTTVAEWVENAAIRQTLSEIGVDFGQGYGIHRPAPIEEF